MVAYMIYSDVLVALNVRRTRKYKNLYSEFPVYTDKLKNVENRRSEYKR